MTHIIYVGVGVSWVGTSHIVGWGPATLPTPGLGKGFQGKSHTDTGLWGCWVGASHLANTALGAGGKPHTDTAGRWGLRT